MTKNQVTFQDLGNIPYRQAWDYQEALVDSIREVKIANRKDDGNRPTRNYLLFCEHPHVYTLGKSGSESHLLWNDQLRNDRKVEFVKTNRGGDITYHGPGQIVGYPILDLDNYFTDLHKYMRGLEEVIISVLNAYGLKGGRIKGLTGVWLESENPAKSRKICAMGVKCSRWITMHGFALNVNTDLDYFQGIVPCGIQDKAVTSLARELQYIPPYEEVKEHLIKNFARVFDSEILYTNQPINTKTHVK